MKNSFLRPARTACCRAAVFGSVLACAVSVLRADFGVTSVSGRYQVDTGAGLVFQINQANGDLVSILYAGKQLQDQSKFSGIASGLGAAAVSATTYDDAIKITCETATLTHYYLARRGFNNIYMATYTTAEPTVGELRYIARLNRANLPNGPRESDILGGTAIEGSDVFLVGTETRSKFYSSVPFIEDQVHGVTGDGVGAYMVIPGNGYEASSGGPFFRDIDNQGGTQQEVYFYMNSGHLQTEAYRMGLHGPYALCINDGPAPSASLDMNFVKNLGLTGYVPVNGRGMIHGKVTGIPSGFPAVLGFANGTAQYWAYANPTSGVYKRGQMIPGTYTMTLYKYELAVASTTVTIPANGSVTQDLASTEVVPAALWRIGDWDGTPAGFLNADKIERMHPSDARMSPWAQSGPFVVGSSDVGAFPMAQFKDVNNPLLIQFELTPEQVANHTLRIGITSSFNGGRPQVSVNPGTANAWNGPNPPAPTKINSRGVTRGTYRGINQTFSVAIPASAFVAGTNIIRITAISGTAGSAFLSPNYVFDAIELDQ
ncbi:hypothetical protein DB347_10035 [Opitutaceae bacterium EW11]|nr:hypothetical protein DB347_10035 [Opitutaceae bacterium EW11]